MGYKDVSGKSLRQTISAYCGRWSRQSTYKPLSYTRIDSTTPKTLNEKGEVDHWPFSTGQSCLYHGDLSTHGAAVGIHDLRAASRGFESQKSQWWWQEGYLELQRSLPVNQGANSMTPRRDYDAEYKRKQRWFVYPWCVLLIRSLCYNSPVEFILI